MYDLVIYPAEEIPPVPVTTKLPSTLTLPLTSTLYPDDAATPIPICWSLVNVAILILEGDLK